MIRLNSYILSDDVKDEMRHKLDKTRQDRINNGGHFYDRVSNGVLK